MAIRKNTVADFEIGDSVYHRSRSSLKMVVIQVNRSTNDVTCRWVDANGVQQEAIYLPQELGKTEDIPRRSVRFIPYGGRKKDDGFSGR